MNVKRKWVQLVVSLLGVFVFFVGGNHAVFADEARTVQTEGSVGFHGKYIPDIPIEPEPPGKDPVEIPPPGATKPGLVAKPGGNLPNLNDQGRSMLWLLGILLILLACYGWKRITEKNEIKG